MNTISTNTIYRTVTRHCNKLPHTLRNILLTLHMIKNVHLKILNISSVNVLSGTVHYHNCLLIVKQHKKYLIIIPQCMLLKYYLLQPVTSQG